MPLLNWFSFKSLQSSNELGSIAAAAVTNRAAYGQLTDRQI